MDDKIERLKLLREPFLPHQISKLPKGTKAQNECDAKEKTNCKVCGGWHHPKIIHLDYVGHAALTDRLLDVDPLWNWEPVALDSMSCPVVDKDGGMWIKLTVCGVTRLGYGDSQGKTGANATKERIGDALRNAAMRFGAALDLWHKGDLHLETEEGEKEGKQGGEKAEKTGKEEAGEFEEGNVHELMAGEMIAAINETKHLIHLQNWWTKHQEDVKALPMFFNAAVTAAKDNQKAILQKKED